MNIVLLMNRTVFILSILSLFISSCDKSYSKEELIQYVNDENHGLIKTKEFGDVKLELIYKPNDFLIQQELSSKKQFSEEEIQEVKNNFNKALYFTLNVSKGGKELEMSAIQSQDQFAKRIEQLSFGMRERIQIKTSNKSEIPLLDYVYPRMYGMTGQTTMLLVFDKEQVINEEWFDVIINGSNLGIGINKFRFESNKILNTPQLDYSYDDKK